MTTLPHYRSVLHADAHHAAQCFTTADEWAQSVQESKPLARAAKAIGEREMRAIVCLVWRVDAARTVEAR
jgi:hypothetical protein